MVSADVRPKASFVPRAMMTRSGLRAARPLPNLSVVAYAENVAPLLPIEWTTVPVLSLISSMPPNTVVLSPEKPMSNFDAVVSMSITVRPLSSTLHEKSTGLPSALTVLATAFEPRE